jgi:hypothetical protein
MNEKQLAILFKKSSEAAAKKASKPQRARNNDHSLPNRPEHDQAAEERAGLFKEMKRREF